MGVAVHALSLKTELVKVVGKTILRCLSRSKQLNTHAVRSCSEEKQMST